VEYTHLRLQGQHPQLHSIKDAVGLMFHKGAEIPGDHPLLEGDGRLVRTMRFTDVAGIETRRPDIERAIVAWCNWRDEESG